MKLWKRPPRTADLEAEMHAHREMLEQQFLREGMSPSEARDAAHRRFGNTTLELENSRDQWSYTLLDALSRDIRFAARVLARRPALTLMAALTIAVGVGANTAVVSVLRTVLLNPAGLRNAEPVVSASVRLDKLNMRGAANSGAEVRDLQRMSDIFATVAAAEGRAWTSDAAGEPVRLRGNAVTPGYFAVFAEIPALGRFFNDSDEHAVVLSNAMWRSQYAADPNIIGRSLQLDGKPHTIIGVASRAFRYPVTADLWTPLILSPERLSQRGRNMNLALFARPHPHVTFEQAQARIQSYVGALKSTKAIDRDDYFIDLEPFAHRVAGDLRRPLWILWAAALLVMLTACANIATLLLARAPARKKEMAIRIALGAGRAQIFRQLLVESLALGLIGGLAGLALASGALSLITRLVLPQQALLSLASFDLTLAAYGLALSILSGALFGIVPALQVLRADQSRAMVRAARHHYRGAFVSLQVAAALVLLVCTGLLLRSLWSLNHIRLGFDPANLSTAYLLKPKNDPGFVTRLDQQLRSTQAATALAYPLPFTSGGLTSHFGIKGRDRKPTEPDYHGEAYFVSPAFFETMRVPVLRGRPFAESDTSSAPTVCIIDARLAERYFPNQDPIGHEIRMYRGWARIVGVAAGIRSTEVAADSRPTVYYPLVQVPYFPEVGLLMRSQAPAYGIMREAVKATNGSVALFDLRSMDHRISETLGIRRVLAILLSLFAGICLLLAATGINGVISQYVAERTPEIGIRMAFGARPGQVLLQFLGSGLAWGFGGVILGLALTTRAVRTLGDQLHGVEPFDPATLVTASASLLLILAAAVFWPSWRASRTDPQVVLRSE